jgi:hypothetical protein
MGMISRNRHSLQTRVLAGLLVALPGQMVLPSFYSQAHAQQLASQEGGLLAKAVQEDSTFQGSHNELSDLPATVDTSATTSAVSSNPSLPAAEPAEATEQGSPLRRRRAAGLTPTTLAQAGATSGGGSSSYGSSSTTGGFNNQDLYKGLALFGAAAGGAGLGLAISNSSSSNNTTTIVSGSK